METVCANSLIYLSTWYIDFAYTHIWAWEIRDIELMIESSSLWSPNMSREHQVLTSANHRVRNCFSSRKWLSAKEGIRSVSCKSPESCTMVFLRLIPLRIFSFALKIQMSLDHLSSKSQGEIHTVLKLRLISGILFLSGRSTTQAISIQIKTGRKKWTAFLFKFVVSPQSTYPRFCGGKLVGSVAV